MYNFFKKIKLSPYIIIGIAFVVLIFIGSGLLSLPFAYKDFGDFTYINALFISFSSVCVTGLSPLKDSISDTFSLFGIIVICVLIQLGGLGFITLFAFFVTLFENKLKINDRFFIKESLGLKGFKNLIHFVRVMILITVVVELAGVVLFMFHYVPRFGFIGGLGHSLFHSINSFTNAGFTLSDSGALIEQRYSFYYTFNTALLVVIGGLGFLVIYDLLNFRHPKMWKLHTKIVLSMTGILIVLGSVLLYVANLSSATNFTLLDGLFMSITSRTAGFTTVKFSETTSLSRLIYSLLMFIGASPLSTGGGVKTTTVFILLITLISFFIGRKPRAFKRSFSQKIFVESTAIIFLSLIIILIGYASIDTMELKNPVLDNNDIRTEAILFETISAFSTTGASIGITSSLSVGSKIVLSLLMLFGRIGPMMIMTMVNDSINKEEKLQYKHVEGNLLVG